ncbi:PREDICTED: putative auxin efflux carrier component 8 isoform X2 [Erythranthe guttata]|uniref:putative auxin efflux carrier component 8 isoform X2 n=1 Tax=Erythranthe guttata TaxID=4155 RepID=UPI00064DFBD0|nr:PREDICTED: putative auxin efflux carrier component 8 isoform X2 [Erythranthe guttata]|eukprot:XP_012834598.1 PREDICTED: putative auxin efflux carrier component 8 isoform X2 [Erythranthe guttata]
MIAWGDIYKVVAAMVPLYVALVLGYGSVKWWRMFKPDHCDAINRFNCYFIIPFFTFRFTAGVDPYHMNFRFLAGDVIAKGVVGVALALWANLCREGKLSWAVTSFSLSSLNNTLVVGVPLLKAMYGALGEDLVVQSSVIQSLLWFPTLLFMLDFWRINNNDADGDSDDHQQQPGQTTHEVQLCSIEITDANYNNTTTSTSANKHEDANGVNTRISSSSSSSSSSNNFRITIKKVLAKLAKNPNLYACAIGLIWALLAKRYVPYLRNNNNNNNIPLMYIYIFMHSLRIINFSVRIIYNRWDLEMPSVVEGSILIMAKAGSGVAMFSMGLFMALQEKMIACGVRLTVYGMVLRFIGGPVTTLVGCLALGIRSRTLHIAIIQAALPQAITSFVFAQEYGLHATVLSTAVIFGTIVSLPLLISYYVALDAFR